MRNFTRLSIACLTILLLQVAMQAQGTLGRLNGSVAGPDGLIPGATIVARDTQTKREQTVQANGEGSFSFSQLESGIYTVTITADCAASSRT